MKDQPIKNYNQQHSSGDSGKGAKQVGKNDKKIASPEAKHNLNDEGLPSNGKSRDAERKDADKAHHSSRS